MGREKESGYTTSRWRGREGRGRNALKRARRESDFDHLLEFDDAALGDGEAKGIPPLHEVSIHLHRLLKLAVCPIEMLSCVCECVPYFLRGGGGGG